MRQRGMMEHLKDKQIVLGVTGGIAAYKSAELLRLLTKQGANVRVLMTEKAQEFVGPLTFAALSGLPVCSSLFAEGEDGSIRHIEWAREADAVVIAPATANCIGKLANGIADDALSTFMLAATCPKILCPAMNTHMYENRAVQRNIDMLEGDGFVILEPGEGELACGTSGAGRLPAPEVICDRLVRVLLPKDLENRRIVVTAGPTREPIDPVRYISNHSSGKMGYAVARAAEYRGARVTLVTGPTSLPAPHGVAVVSVETAAEMEQAVFDLFPKAAAVIKVAAVADYRPGKQEPHKIKKTADGITLELQKNPDILSRLGREKKGQVLVGFAAETRDLDENASEKLKKKNLDMVVGNLVGKPGTGFGAETNQVTFYYREGEAETLPVMPKEAVAHLLLDRIVQRIWGKRG